MSFENYRDNIIENFVEDMTLCKTLPEGGLSETKIQEINKRFEKHRHCYDNKDEFDQECDVDLITTTIYGNNISVAIECNNCNEVIIDDEILNLMK